MEESGTNKVKTEISEENFREKLKLNIPDEKQGLIQQDENEDDFSFVFASPYHSPVSADDAFLDGQCPQIFPVFDQTLLYRNVDGKQTLRPSFGKLFVEEGLETEEEETVRPFCEWSSGGDKTVKEASPQSCKKSNSTGFSKLWKFREHVFRSNSDGRRAFVFLNNMNRDSKNDNCEGEKAEKSRERHERSRQKATGTKTVPSQKASKGEKVIKMTGADNNHDKNKGKAKTASSVYEEYYVRNRVMTEGDKHRPYSPYRKNPVGLFFTNVNGFSRNVHPF